MKSLTVGLLVLSLLPAGPALAHRDDDSPSISLHDSCCEPPLHWADRWNDRTAHLAITTEDGGVTLLIDDHDVALQLSNRTMHKVDRKLHEKEDEDSGPLGDAIKSAVLASVRSLLDHSMECRIRDLRSVEYRDDRLVMITNDGDRIFEHVDVDNQDVLESFSPDDARAFVAEFQRVKHRR